MKKTAMLVLRVGLAITFFWIGVRIWMNPEGWGAFLQPWALGLLPAPLKTMMLATAVLDMAVGVLLVINPLAWIGALLGAGHIPIVLITSGINDVTVRDIGLLAAALALLVEAYPNRWPRRLPRS